MRGKVCLLTGGTAGIGFETCRSLVHRGANVILTGTTLEKAELAADGMSGAGEVFPYQLDLTNSESIRRLAQAVLDRFERLDILIHNAGMVLPRRYLNSAGIEYTWAVVYLGPFLLTQLLEPLFGSQGPTRIINVASDLHRRETLDWNDLMLENGYNFLKAYSRAELAKVMWTRELSRRYSVKKATVNSLHPGGVRTQLFRNFRGPLRWLMWLSNLLKKSPATGARTSLYLACSEDVEQITGEYFVNCRTRRVSKTAQDVGSSARLWEESMELLARWEEVG